MPYVLMRVLWRCSMSSSMLLSADDLATGEINTHNEVWVKPGRSYAVPISIATPFTTIKWEFTVQPKVMWGLPCGFHSLKVPVPQGSKKDLRDWDLQGIRPTGSLTLRDWDLQGLQTYDQTFTRAGLGLYLLGILAIPVGPNPCRS
jgi:hypothetical protein